MCDTRTSEPGTVPNGGKNDECTCNFRPTECWSIQNYVESKTALSFRTEMNMVRADKLRPLLQTVNKDSMKATVNATKILNFQLKQSENIWIQQRVIHSWTVTLICPKLLMILKRYSSRLYSCLWLAAEPSRYIICLEWNGLVVTARPWRLFLRRQKRRHWSKPCPKNFLTQLF